MTYEFMNFVRYMTGLVCCVGFGIVFDFIDMIGINSLTIMLLAMVGYAFVGVLIDMIEADVEHEAEIQCAR